MKAVIYSLTVTAWESKYVGFCDIPSHAIYILEEKKYYAQTWKIRFETVYVWVYDITFFFEEFKMFTVEAFGVSRLIYE